MEFFLSSALGISLVASWNQVQPEETLSYTPLENVQEFSENFEKINLDQYLVALSNSVPQETEKGEPKKETENPSLPLTVSASQADIVIHYFDDYFCEHCEEYKKTLRTFRYRDFLQEKKIAVQWHVVPTSGELTLELAKATHCAEEQGEVQKWDMHDALFDTVKEERTEEKTRRIAEHYQFDMETFDECMASERILEKVEHDLNLARKLFIDRVPATVFGDEVFFGPLPLENIEFEVRKMEK